MGATLRLKALVELELRAICTIYARKDLRRAPFDIWLKSAFSWVHHTQREVNPKSDSKSEVYRALYRKCIGSVSEVYRVVYRECIGSVSGSVSALNRKCIGTKSGGVSALNRYYIATFGPISGAFG